MVPTPVTVSMLPLIDPGPETTLKATLSPDVAIALSEIGDTPYVTGENGEKLMVCDARLTTWLNVDEVLELKPLPEEGVYAAVMLCVPTVRVLLAWV